MKVYTVNGIHIDSDVGRPDIISYHLDERDAEQRLIQLKNEMDKGYDSFGFPYYNWDVSEGRGYVSSIEVEE